MPPVTKAAPVTAHQKRTSERPVARVVEQPTLAVLASAHSPPKGRREGHRCSAQAPAEPSPAGEQRMRTTTGSSHLIIAADGMRSLAPKCEGTASVVPARAPTN